MTASARRPLAALLLLLAAACGGPAPIPEESLAPGPTAASSPPVPAREDSAARSATGRPAASVRPPPPAAPSPAAPPPASPPPAAPQAPAAAAPAADGAKVFSEKCSVCHDAERIEGSAVRGVAWKAFVGRHYAELTEPEREALIHHLEVRYP